MTYAACTEWAKKVIPTLSNFGDAMKDTSSLPMKSLQEKVYRRRKLTSVEQLKLAIIEEWRNIGQRFIDRSINEWRQRLQEVLHKQGGHIEHDF